MKNLTRKEELIMLSILNLKKEAYLVSIVDHLAGVTGKNVSLTSVHVPLSRLEKEGLILSVFGQSSAVRGGRRKKIYRISKKGFEALGEYKRISDAIWKNYSPLTSDKD